MAFLYTVRSHLYRSHLTNEESPKPWKVKSAWQCRRNFMRISALDFVHVRLKIRQFWRNDQRIKWLLIQWAYLKMMGTFLNQSLAVTPITLQIETRMHSSRMRTGRSLTVCCSLLPEGEGSAPGGSAPVGGVCLVGGGCLLLGGSAWSGGWCAWSGGCLLGGGGMPACTEADTPLWTDTRLWKYYLGPNFVAAGNYISPLNIPRKVCMVRDAQMLQHYRALERIAIGAQWPEKRPLLPDSF